MIAGDHVAVRDPDTLRWTEAQVLSYEYGRALVVVLRSARWGVFPLRDLRLIHVVRA